VASFVETQGHAGDEGNFEALYDTYRGEVQRLASYLLRNAADAEDASQTVFLNVLRALRQGVRPAEPRAWLLAITRNVCFSRGRAAACRPDEVELDSERASEPVPDDGPTVEEIVGALSRMLPNQRTALILRDFRGARRSEICELLSMSPAGVETLLTRARASFREEIQAGEQPFDCADTRRLVEEQLAGLITVAGRHSLRTHLRHCAACSTLARAVRSSRGKLAALVFWPGDLISRLAAALSQAPTAIHVAAAVTSTAAIASVVIPAAVTQGLGPHAEGQTPPGPAVQAVPASRVTTTSDVSTASQAATVGVAAVAHRVFAHARPVHGKHGAAPDPRTARKRPRGHATHHTVRAARATPAVATPAVATPAAAVAAGAATTTGTSDRPAPAAPITIQQVSPHAAATAPAASQPVAASPRSPSPAVRPSSTKPNARQKSKPKPKPKLARRAPRRRGGGSRRPTGPAFVQAAAPAESMPSASDGSDNGAGQGYSSGSTPSSGAAQSSPQTSSDSTSAANSGGRSSDASSTASGNSSASNGSTPGGR
jgi:RNA polymerase sigma factor (sigma-70 family)